MDVCWLLFIKGAIPSSRPFRRECKAVFPCVYHAVHFYSCAAMPITLPHLFAESNEVVILRVCKKSVHEPSSNITPPTGRDQQ